MRFAPDAAFIMHNSVQKIQKLYLSFDESEARNAFLASPSVPFLFFISHLAFESSQT
jgi:hypothetical protein